MPISTAADRAITWPRFFGDGHSARSEEHTSELQSQSNLVCRLLLEKKKHNTIHYGIGDHPSPRRNVRPTAPARLPLRRAGYTCHALFQRVHRLTPLDRAQPLLLTVA